MSFHTVCDTGCDFITIQAAANAATDGDTIQLLFTSPHTEFDIVINKSVTVEGLGETNTIVQAAASPGSAPNRVFFVTADQDVHFRDMTIRHGDTNSTGGGLHNAGSDVSLSNVHVRENEATLGGGIYSEGGTLILLNVFVFNNSMAGDGGGIYNAGTLLIDDSTVNNNQNAWRGAGIFNSGLATIRNSDISNNDVLTGGGFGQKGGGIYNVGTINLINSTIHYNQMTGSSGFSDNGGGGIYNEGGMFFLYDSVVEHNSVGEQQDGGGIYLRGGEMTIRHAEINNNTADESSSNTGGLYMSSGTLKMRDTTVRDNRGDYGGGLYLSYGSVAISHTTISGNESDIGGGFYVCNSQETIALSNVTISDNEAIFDGGGVYVCAIGELYLSNVTISDNRADSNDDGNGDGGGIYPAISNQDSGMVHIKNSIIANNVDESDWPAVGAHDCYGELMSEGYNLIGTLGFSVSGPPCSITGDGTGNIIRGDPMLDVLADNGGPTPTHALMAGSDAINKGNPAGCTDMSGNPLLDDQRHGLRPDHCDMGAFEFGALIEHLYLPIGKSP